MLNSLGDDMYYDYRDNPALHRLSQLLESRAKRDRQKGKKAVNDLSFPDMTPQQIYHEMKTKSIYVAYSDIRLEMKFALSAEDRMKFAHRSIIEEDYIDGKLTKEERDELLSDLDTLMMNAFVEARRADELLLEAVASSMELERKVILFMKHQK